MCTYYYFVQVSGLSEWIGSRMVVLGVLPNWSVVVLVAVLVAALTEFTSNTATSALLLPIIGELVSTPKLT